jgi:tRNA modification GTPase
MYIEAAIDFPEEEVDFLADSHIELALAEIEAALVETQQQTQQGALLREGITLVFAGRPNAGKSSLMNHYSGRETSIVTNVPGTTRDIVDEYIHLDGVPLRLVDTAGLRDSDDLVEKEGIRRARQEILQADIILLLIDYAAHPSDWREQALQLQGETGETGIKLVVLNKIDKQPLDQDLDFELPVVGISAIAGDGLQLLTDKVKQLMGLDTQIEGQFIARSRHLDALHRAALAVAAGKEQLLVYRAGELLAEELRQAQEALNEITGEFSSDDLLGRIFSSFCIGK